MIAYSFLLVVTLSGILCSVWGLSVKDVMVNDGKKGDNYFDPKNAADFGVLKDVSTDKEAMKKFSSLAKLPIEKGSDGETADFIKKYFWGQSNGIIMEIGAMDGEQYSQSKPLEAQAGWHRILVEGSPTFAKGLAANAIHAFAFTCAICDDTREVHYVSSNTTNGGIAEFMSPHFVKAFHKELLSVDHKQWSTLPHVQKVACFPLAKLLETTQIKHINAFIVDVEGGELAMLHSVDWAAVRFDVIVVETDKKNRVKGYEGQVTAFLTEKDYHPVFHKGRNTWYKHVDFIPSRMPEAKKSGFF